MESVRSLPFPAAADPGEIRRAQIGEFARRTPINAFVTVSVSIFTAAILGGSAPRPWLLLWLGAQLVFSLALLARWLLRRRRSAGRRSVPGSVTLRAALYSLVSGLIWGALPLLLAGAPASIETAVCITVAAVAAGSTTTLSAIPSAAISFVLGSLVPFAVYFSLKDDPVYAILALLSVCFTVAMIASSRLVHGTFLAAVRARLENAAILDRFYSERQDWIEVSETADGFALLDGAGRLLLWNGNLATLLSLPADALARGVPLRELLARGAAPLDLPGGESAGWIERLLGSVADEARETAAREFDNGRWLRAAARRTERGHVTVAFTDVTALKLADRAVLEREAALAKSQRLEAIGKLAGGIAHDFNNLLTAISGFAEVLAGGVRDRPESHRHAMRILQACARASALTRQLLAYGRRQMLQPRVVDLNALVGEAHDLLVRLVPENVEFRLDLHPAALPIHVDPSQIERALVNLVINARDAMPAGGQVRIRTTEVERAEPSDGGAARSARWVVLAVGDDGSGMDSETRARIFEPFFTTKPEGAGSGLGLATVYGSIVQSGGVVEVDSAPGRGTTFRILLPRTDRSREENDPQANPSPTGDAVRGVVLVVEDDPVVREFVGEILLRAGCAVLSAGRPLAALEICRSHEASIDLILSDVVMPEMSGPAFVERALKILPGTPVVFMSGYAEDALGAHGIIDPGVVLLRKPFTSQELRAAVAEELRKAARAGRGPRPSGPGPA